MSKNKWDLAMEHGTIQHTEQFKRTIWKGTNSILSFYVGLITVGVVQRW